ncbi:MAG: GDP-L-fucose synthase [Fulvivirga sp.]
MSKESNIYIAGHNGMVGSAIFRYLKNKGFKNIFGFSSKEYDLRSPESVSKLFDQVAPEYVFLAAAKVGGIHANNTMRGEFLYDNLMISTNVIHQSYITGVKKLLYLGSSCIYPKYAEQPIKEDSLLTGSLEHTNEPYAIAKIAGLKLCETYRHQYGCDFISAMPTNLYGYGDNYDLNNSHVLPALIRKFHEAKSLNKESVTIWGTGSPLREFLFADDLAKACVLLMEKYSEGEPINIGTGKDISIKDLALLIKEVVGFNGKLEFDTTMPDGTPRKLLDVSKIQEVGFEPETGLRDGIELAYQDFLKNYEK